MSDITITSQDPTSVDITVASSTSVEISPETASTITVTSKGPKGDTGAQGEIGAQGAAGVGVISGGFDNQFLQKDGGGDYDLKWSAYTLPSADGDDGQVLTTDGAGSVSFAHPKTISENVKNVSGGTLIKGTPVHVTGSVGNQAEVIAADAATNYPAHFVLDQDLADDGEGLGIALGFINNVDVPDASIYSEGQTVYLAESGGWTTTKPTGTNAIQNLGIIIKVNTSGNKISGIVMGAGRSNDVPNIPNGQTWIGNASGVATPTTLATVATSGSYNDLSDTSKFKQVHSMSFIDDMATTKHFLPWKDINEQTTIYEEEAAMLMPYDGRIVSVSVRIATVTGSGNLTIDVNTAATGANIFAPGSFTQEETETLVVTDTDDHHTFHFVFDNAQHFEAGDLCAIGIQSSADLTSTTYFHVTTVVEFDTATDLGSSSTEHESNP